MILIVGFIARIAAKIMTCSGKVLSILKSMMDIQMKRECLDNVM